MLFLDRKTLHVLEAMLTIAAHNSTQPLSGREIASSHNLPPRYLEQDLQKLVHAGLLRGVRGPRGGYVLAREKRRISLAEIVEAVQEHANENETACCSEELNALFEQLGNAARDKLQAVTLQDIAPCAAAVNRTADFVI